MRFTRKVHKKVHKLFEKGMMDGKDSKNRETRHSNSKEQG
jgi:hypothetical protein